MNSVIKYMEAILIALFICNWIIAVILQRYVVKQLIIEEQSNDLLPIFTSSVLASSFRQSIDLFKVVFSTKRFCIKNHRLEMCCIAFRISVCLQAFLFLFLAYFIFLCPRAL